MSSTTVHNGGVRLTGWAQAAARALPKPQQQQQQQQPKAKSGTASSAARNGGAPVLTPSASATSLSSGGARGKKKQIRPPYNRDEVRSYMKSLFEQQTATISSKETFGIARGSERKTGSLDWGAVTSSKNRNKKYGCLNDIAQVLCR